MTELCIEYIKNVVKCNKSKKQNCWHHLTVVQYFLLSLSFFSCQLIKEKIEQLGIGGHLLPCICSHYLLCMIGDEFNTIFLQK